MQGSGPRMTSDLEQRLLKAFDLQNKGRAAEAETGYRAILKADPANVHALNLLGVLCLQSARASEAAELIGRALKVTPDDPEALNNYGLALKSLGRLTEAINAFERATQLARGHHGPLANLGAAYFEFGRFDDAARACAAALSRDPKNVGCLTNFANALCQMSRLPAAEKAARHAIALDPGSAPAHAALGEILLKNCRFEEAVKALRTASQLDPQFIDATITLATTHKEMGDLPLARRTIEGVLEHQPGNPRAHYALGVMLEQSGDFEGAAAAFSSSIEASPEYAPAHYQRAQLKSRTPMSDEIEAMKALLERPHLTLEQQRYFAFGAGAALDRLGHYDEALNYFNMGHAKVSFGYDQVRVENRHQRIKAAFSQPLAASTRESRATPAPLLILGMPRSGTSLVEQILASHPDIHGGGESSFLADAVNEAAALVGEPFPDGLGRLGVEQLKEIGTGYLGRLCAGQSGVSWITDKTPMNFQYVGLAIMAVPGVRIIHCMRDPLETCLSIYKLPFDQSQNYASTMTSLGHFYSLYKDLMEHWRSVAEPCILDVRYENVVDDVARESERMLDFLGLPFDDAVLRFHETERLVKTPSAGQVRQPIYRASLRASDNYGAGLEPLRQALGGSLR